MHYPHHPAVLIYPPALWLACLLAAVVLNAFAPLHIGEGLFLRVLGLALLACALFVLRWAHGHFIAHGEDPDPTTQTFQVVQHGPYKHSRNPMYSGATLLMFSLALLLNSWWFVAATVVLFIVLHHGVVLREERYLAHRFGKHYEAYMQKVSRWV